MRPVVKLLERSGRALPESLRHRLIVRVAVASVVTAAVAVFSLWPFWTTNAVTGAINLLVAVSFVATGVALAEAPLHRTTAGALGACAVFWLISWWWKWPPEWQVGPLALLSNVSGYLWFVFGGIALLRYPAGELATRGERTYFAVMAGWILLGKVGIALVTRPEWEGYSSWSWWPAIAPSRSVHDVLVRIFYVGVVALAVIMLFLLIAKLQRSRGVDRLDALPVTVAACTVTICGGIYLSARLFNFSPQVIEALQTAMGASALVTPLAFLMAVLRRRLAHSAVADLVVRIAGAPTVAHIEQELRGVLGPSVKLWTWSADARRYVDTTGDSCDYPPTTGRWAEDICASDGASLAVLVVDDSLRRFPALVRSALVAAGLALEIHAQLVEVRASRTRITTAADDERRRIERDLHDGAQQGLLAVSARLSAARLQAEASPDAVVTIDQAQADLRTAVAELRRLARGIHPAVLGQSGLLPAVENVAERLPLAVELQIPAVRLRADIEATVYFLACEALTNAVRHAQASSATVAVVLDDECVDVRICDDGCGGARLVSGSGLSGMQDRIEAVGGRLEIDSPDGGGTRLRAVLPCA